MSNIYRHFSPIIKKFLTKSAFLSKIAANGYKKPEKSNATVRLFGVYCLFVFNYKISIASPKEKNLYFSATAIL